MKLHVKLQQNCAAKDNAVYSGGLGRELVVDIFDNVIWRKRTKRDVENDQIENCVNQPEIKEGAKYLKIN